MPESTRKQSAIGLDISDASVKLLQFGVNEHVIAYEKETLPKGIMFNGTIMEREKLIAIIVDVLERGDFLTNPKTGRYEAVLSIPESNVFTHYFTVPPKKQTHSTLQECIQEEIARSVPQNIDELYWDYTIIGDGDEENIVWVGARKIVVDEYLALCRESIIDIVAIDIELFSIARALLVSGEGASIVVDIGARTTSIGVFDTDRAPHLSMLTSVGGEYLTAAIQGALKIEAEKAEERKQKRGFNDKKSAPVLEKAFERIITDIRNAIFYFERIPGQHVESIVLTGGSALLPGIVSFMGERTDRATVIGEPSLRAGVHEKIDEHPVFIANTIGLARRPLTETVSTINLLPGKSKVTSANRYRLHVPKSLQRNIQLSDLKYGFVGLFVVGALFFLGWVIRNFIFV